MENDIALVASGYLLLRIGALALFGYLVYRVLRSQPARIELRLSHRSSRPDSGAA